MLQFIEVEWVGVIEQNLLGFLLVWVIALFWGKICFRSFDTFFDASGMLTGLSGALHNTVVTW